MINGSYISEDDYLDLIEGCPDELSEEDMESLGLMDEIDDSEDSWVDLQIDWIKENK